MKKIWLIAIILLMFGCSQTKNDQNEISKPMEQKAIYTKEQKQNSPTVNTKRTAYKETNDHRKLTNNKKPKQSENDKQAAPKESVMLDVGLIRQNPELKYGCEVTSLAMMLKFAGVKTNKMELYEQIKKDPDPIVKSKTGDILHWGNPAEGFVGDMTGKEPGYAAFDQPMIDLINKKLPGRAVNLTNKPFEHVLAHMSRGLPVVVWTTGDYRLPDRWEGWHHKNEHIKTPLDLHVVVLVGYDSNHVYLNDPLSGKKQAKVGKEQFISSWKALQSRAVSYQ